MLQARVQLTKLQQIGDMPAGTATFNLRKSTEDGFKTPVSLANGPGGVAELHIDNADAYGELEQGAEYIVTIEKADFYTRRVAREQKANEDAAATKAPAAQAVKP